MPVALLTGYYPATRKGLTPYDVTQDYAKAADAWYEFNTDFKPDCISGPMFAAIPGRAFEAIDTKILNWPGHGVAEGGQLPVHRSGVDVRG